MPSPDPVTSMSMLQRARHGEDEAWNRLVEIYGPIVHAQCLHKGLQDNDARDVTMEVFRSVWQSLDKFSKVRDSDRFLHFLRSITSRRIIDHWRNEEIRQDKPTGQTDWLSRHGVGMEGELTDEQTESVWEKTSLVEALAAEILRRVAETFQPRTVNVFRRVVMDGVSVNDVAEEFSMSRTAVRTNVSRVKKWVSNAFGELPENMARFSSQG